MKGAVQKGLLLVYEGVRRSGVLSTRVGRRLSEIAYWTYKRLWETDIETLRTLVSPGHWIVDVGANVGYYTVQFARWVSEGGRVIAIEPEPQNLLSLNKTVGRRANPGLVSVVAAVAAEREGELRLRLNPSNPADHRIANEGISVKAVTLDGLLADCGHPGISLIKIDVQGAELRVLKGAAQTLRRCRPAILIEMDDGALASFGTSPEEVQTFLEELGYRMVAFTGQIGNVVLSRAAAAELRAELGYADFLFLPASAPTAGTSPARLPGV